MWVTCMTLCNSLFNQTFWPAPTLILPWTNADVFVRSSNQESAGGGGQSRKEAKAAEAQAAEEAKAGGLVAEPDAIAAGNKENAAADR